MGRKDTLAAKSIRKMYEQLNLNQSDIFSKADFAEKIKKAFRSIHIFITSNEDEDIAFIRQRFFEWRKAQQK